MTMLDYKNLSRQQKKKEKKGVFNFFKRILGESF